LKRAISIASGLWVFILTTVSQNVILTGESPNYFLKVDEVLGSGVRITQTLPGELGNFHPGDKVLLIQLTGVTLDSASASFKTTEARSKKSVQNAGNFEILQVDEVITGPDTTIYFTDNVSYSYDSFEKIQLVKLIEGETVTVSGTVYPKAWDGNVGGILGIIGTDSVKLETGSVLDVSAKGFRGGAIPDEIYTRGCRYGLSDVIKDTLYFRTSQLGRSGNKGEGIITVKWPYTKGTGFNINGGGAGNGQFSGGGGGSNYRLGGDGGKQSASCLALYSAMGGWGGFACKELYDNPLIPRIVMGGGGGSGTRMNSSTPSRGGNGGGIIIIITGTLMSKSTTASIRANGENATPATTSGSGGGGGAGGTVIVDATEIAGQLFNVKIRGGNGAYTSTAAPNCNGAGGSGSGGVFWHAGSTFAAVSIDSTNGSPGSTAGGATYSDQIGRSGLLGTKLKRLMIPLSGFLFNSIKGIDTICTHQIPRMLTASQPKGGNGSYGYVWQQSINNSAWAAASGTGTLRTFQPVALTQTTWYRRIVTSQNALTAEIIHDTSRVIKVFVYPAISNNHVTGTDTICQNSNAKPLMPSGSLSGGNGIYSYTWQESTNGDNWGAAGTSPSYDPPVLTSSRYYRRIVHSTAYCNDTSNILSVKVLPSIGNNTFSISDTSICENTSPGRMNISLPNKGDGYYDYQWQYKINSGNWNSIALTEDSSRYTVGLLTATTGYRRIVYSGNDHACIDTSNTKTVTVKPLVSNNNILGAAVRYVCYNSPVSLSGSTPANGFGTYAYKWEQSSDNLSWETINSLKDYQSNGLTSAKYFRRTVYSSPELHECISLSNVVQLRINPLPVGNVIDFKDTVCAGSVLYVKFDVTGNKPFNVTITGNSEQHSKNNISGPLDSIAFSPLSTQSFVISSIQDDSGCYANPTGFVPLIPATVYLVPDANAGIDSAVCGDFYQCTAIKSNPGYKGSWTGSDATFSNPALANSNVTVNSFGTHVLTWTESNWHCTNSADVHIAFFEQPDVPDAGHNQELDFTYQTQLQATPAMVGSGKWTVIKGKAEFDDDTSPESFVSELSPDTWLKWTVTNGKCPSVEDSLNIIIDPLVIPKGFTPDGDQHNQKFQIGHPNAINISLQVFNSAGILVFESDNYNEGELWEGKNQNGVELPEGTYYYIARIKVTGREKEIVYKSFVEIMRK
jgi:gliding motility-associated-like protein